MSRSSWRPTFDRRVRVRADPDCSERRPFLFCERRPTVCETHRGASGGTLYVDGHRPEEAGQAGAVISHLGGENAGHEWIVRFDRNLAIEWPDGQTIVVNGGAYAADELEPVRDLPGLTIVAGAELPPLGFVGTTPRAERFRPPSMAARATGRGGTPKWRARGKPLGGLWTSPLLGGAPLWAGHATGPRGIWWRVEPDPEARVLVIDTLCELEAIIAAFPHHDVVSRVMQQHFRRSQAEIDFEALAEEVDAVWLTERVRGEIMHGPALDLVHYTTWDVETVLFLRWKVRGVSRIARTAR